MRKRDLVRRVSELLKENDIKKPTRAITKRLYISDDDGNTQAFETRMSASRTIYTQEDVRVIIETMIYTIKEALRDGQDVNIPGFGKFSLKFHKGYTVTAANPLNVSEVPPRYKIKFSPFPELQESARLFQASQTDIWAKPDLDEDVEAGDEEGGDGGGY